MRDERNRILREFIARSQPPSLDVAEFCFPKQRAFISDPARFKAACCSRRAGKTMGIAAQLLATASSRPGVAVLYFTLTRQQAKRIIWDPLKQINEKYRLGGDPNESELTLRFPNGSIIYLSGAKDRREVAKYLGFPLVLAVGDEAQSFRPYLKELVDDAISPTLLDYAGQMILMGTPGPVPVGYFYEITKTPTWSNHSWTLLDNPHLQAKSGIDPMELVLDECRRRNVGLNDPSIQRQFFGKWTVDSDALVFHWTEANHYDEIPVSNRWEYVIGGDLGHDDADALAVLGWCPESPHVYLLDEEIKAKQGITPLAEQVERLVAMRKPLATVMDAGGLGKKIIKEMQDRFSLPVKAAEKNNKFGYIELLNDAMRTGVFKAKRGSRFVADAQLLEWDLEKCVGDRKVVSDQFHSDIADAVLYAYRESLHWIRPEQRPALPPLGSQAYRDAELAALEERLEQKSRQKAQVMDPWAPSELADDIDWSRW